MASSGVESNANSSLVDANGRKRKTSDSDTVIAHSTVTSQFNSVLQSLILQLQDLLVLPSSVSKWYVQLQQLQQKTITQSQYLSAILSPRNVSLAQLTKAINDFAMLERIPDKSDASASAVDTSSSSSSSSQNSLSLNDSTEKGNQISSRSAELESNEDIFYTDKVGDDRSKLNSSINSLIQSISTTSKLDKPVDMDDDIEEKDQNLSTKSSKSAGKISNKSKDDAVVKEAEKQIDEEQENDQTQVSSVATPTKAAAKSRQSSKKTVKTNTKASSNASITSSTPSVRKTIAKETPFKTPRHRNVDESSTISPKHTRSGKVL
jgi:hypothetical protein